MERKEAIEVVKKNWPDSSFTMLREALETLIPELKESEDEKIIDAIKYGLKCLGWEHVDGIKISDMNAWLERQSEHANFRNKIQVGDKVTRNEAGVLVNLSQLKRIAKPAEEYNITGIGSKHAQGKLGEMIKNLKSVDNVEPKFHKGDWIIHQGTENIYQVVALIDNQYQLKYGDNYTIQKCADVDRCARLLDITKDAKDGDVLAVELGNDYPSPFIAICKERGLDYFNSHCFISFDAKFYTGDTGHDVTGIHPATKEQRDTLEKAMADAGYTFDFEKKELKKIKQKSAWSEEDEKLIDTIISDLERHGGKESSCYSSEINYLKSLKDRISPKQEWSEEDEEMLNLIIARLHSHPNLDLEEYGKEYDWLNYNLKSLKPQNRWKPSDEQINILFKYAEQNNKDGSILTSLYQDLKKLKG